MRDLHSIPVSFLPLAFYPSNRRDHPSYLILQSYHLPTEHNAFYNPSNNLTRTPRKHHHVPAAFKREKVILKKPTLDLADISNYQSVALYFRKNYKCILNQFFIFHNATSKNYSGIKATHFMETALLSVTEKLHVARSPSCVHITFCVSSKWSYLRMHLNAS